MQPSERSNPFGPSPQVRVDGETQMAEMLRLLRAIEQHLDLIAANCSPHGRAALPHADRQLLAKILPVLGSGLGSRGRSLTASDALADLEQQGSPIEMGAKSLGRVFARCEGLPVAGFRIERNAELRGATVWKIWRV